MIDLSLCTFATRHSLHDVKRLMSSVKRHSPDIPLVILCDLPTATELEAGIECPNIIYHPPLDEWKDKENIRLEHNETWKRLMLTKIKAIKIAHSIGKPVLYVDSDIIFLDDPRKDWPELDAGVRHVGLSKHGITGEKEVANGIYNAGYVYCHAHAFPDWWKIEAEKGGYYEQSALEKAGEHFNCFQIRQTHNLGWWRIYEGDAVLESALTADANGHLLFHGEPVISIHTHAHHADGNCGRFNAYLRGICDLPELA